MCCPADLLDDLPGAGVLVLWHRDGSIAKITADGTAQQAGPRRLADILGALWQRHQDAACPPRDAYRVTVTPDGAHTVIAETGDGPWIVLAEGDEEVDG